MFYVKVFNDTGFNLVNVPDSMELLLNNFQANQFVVSDIDILQVYHNTSIRLKVPNGEEDIATADFLIMSNREHFDDPLARLAAYTIDGYTMEAADVVTLQVTMEPFLTCGGVNNINFLDGMTVRHHIDPEDDVFGAYVEDDPLLQPSKSPRAHYKGQFFDTRNYGAPSNTGSMIALTSIELVPDFEMDLNTDLVINNDGNFITSVEGDPGVKKFQHFQCSPPHTIDVQPDQEAGMTVVADDPYKVNQFDCFTMYIMEQTGVPYGLSTDQFMRTLKGYYEWGMTSLIKGAYVLPAFWASSTYFNVGQALGEENGKIQEIKANPQKIVTDIPIMSAANDNGGWKEERYAKYNKRCFSGKENAFIFVSTASGNILEKIPETLLGVGKIGSSEYSGTGTQISSVANLNETDDKRKKVMLFGWCDPRPSGGVKFHVVNKQDQYRVVTVGPYRGDGFYFKEILKGGNWKQVNLSLLGAEGYRVNQLNYSAQRNFGDSAAILEGMSGYAPNYSSAGKGANAIGEFISDINYLSEEKAYRKQGFTGVEGMLNTGLNYGGETLAGRDVNFGTIGGEPGLLNRLQSLAGTGNRPAATILARDLQAKAEAMQYIASNVPKPIIAFEGAYDEDPSGNALLVYQIVPDEADIDKYNKVLNQYGYRITEPLTETMMRNRPSYNYIQATGVSINSEDVPKSVRDDCATAFAQGIRIWHKKPDPTLFALWDGGNVQEVNNNV